MDPIMPQPPLGGDAQAGKPQQLATVTAHPNAVLKGDARAAELSTIAVSLYEKNTAPADVLNVLLTINAMRCDPPLFEPEIQSISDRAAAEDGLALKSFSFASLTEIIRDPAYRAKIKLGDLEFDEFSRTVTIKRVPISDSTVSGVREQIERNILVPAPGGRMVGVQFGQEDVGRALYLVASEKPYHPIRDFLRSLRWDGQPRIQFLKFWLHTDGEPLDDLLLRKFMIKLIARAFRPGCKVDTILILQGAQGFLKSTFFKLIASEAYFTDSGIDFHSKDAFMQMSGAWIVEMPELESLIRARDANSIKAFITSTTDRFRPPYGRHVIQVPRTSVIVGTTNDDRFLTDPTGNRRFWIVRVRATIDEAAILASREQLLAEAVAAYDAGEKWWLTATEERALAERQRDFEVPDPWEQPILSVAYSYSEGITANQALGIVGKDLKYANRGDEMRVASILRRAGFMGKRRNNRRIWIPPEGSITTTASSDGDGLLPYDPMAPKI